MKRAIAWWLAGVVGFVLALELLFRILPVSTSTETGYYTDPLILTYPPHHRWTVSTGWDLRNAQTLEANNLGYAAGRDFERNEQAVALIGDSFVEASMLAASDRPGAQLERALGSRPVFAIGSPGTALLDYAERIRFAHEQLGVRDFVILMERGDVKQSLCGSGNINGPCLDSKTLTPRIETLPVAGIAKRIFRHSALAQYFFSQLKFSPQKLWQQARSPSHPIGVVKNSLSTDQSHARLPDVSETVMLDVDAITNAFFARVKPHAFGKLVIVVDSDRNALYGGKIPADPARSRFIYLARAAGARIIDTESLFRAQLARSPLRFEVGPYDGHLNALGINLIAQAIAGEICQP